MLLNTALLHFNEDFGRATALHAHAAPIAAGTVPNYLFARGLNDGGRSLRRFFLSLQSRPSPRSPCPPSGALPHVLLDHFQFIGDFDNPLKMLFG